MNKKYEIPEEKGIDGLSVSPSITLPIRKVIREINYSMNL